MAEKILVTGAGGTVGRDIVRDLAANQEQVVAGVHSPEKVGSWDWPDTVEVVRFDWTESETWERIIPGVERVGGVTPLCTQLTTALFTPMLPPTVVPTCAMMASAPALAISAASSGLPT